MSVSFGRLHPVSDVSAADWVVDGIDGRAGTGVRELLPSCFESYARILHPASCVGDSGRREKGETVTWEQVAEETGRKMHSRVQFDSLFGAGWREPRDYEPAVGELPPDLLTALCGFLAGHTETPQRCWFCLWDGWGWIDGSPSAAIISTSEGVDDPVIEMPPAFPPEVLRGPRVSVPGRNYILFEGPLVAATDMGWRIGELVNDVEPSAGVERDEFEPQTPSMFWPEDRAWCVATEIDLDSTYLGGSEAMVQALLADKRFEAWRATLDDPIDSGSDEING